MVPMETVTYITISLTTSGTMIRGDNHLLEIVNELAEQALIRVTPLSDSMDHVSVTAQGFIYHDQTLS